MTTPDDVAGRLRLYSNDREWAAPRPLLIEAADALEASRREFDGAMALYHVARKRAEAAEAAITAARLAGLEEAAEEAEQWEQPGGRIAARIRARIAALKATAA